MYLFNVNNNSSIKWNLSIIKKFESTLHTIYTQTLVALNITED